MENYLINEKTIAILKKVDQIIIYNVDKTIVSNIKIKRLINNNCLVYGSSLNGRKKYAQQYLKIKYRVPIIISENKKLILLQLNSIREEECLFIMGNKIIDFEEINNNLKIKCVNNQEFITKLSKYSLEKLLINYLKLYNNLV